MVSVAKRLHIYDFAGRAADLDAPGFTVPHGVIDIVAVAASDDLDVPETGIFQVSNRLQAGQPAVVIAIAVIVPVAGAAMFVFGFALINRVPGLIDTAVLPVSAIIFAVMPVIRWGSGIVIKPVSIGSQRLLAGLCRQCQCGGEGRYRGTQHD